MRYVLSVLLLILSAQVAGAQVIRGSVEDSTGTPINDVVVSVLAATTDSVVRSTRTDNSGDFSINVVRAGRYRVRLSRIGYAQQTSPPLDVRPSEIVTLRLKMAVAQVQLGAVTVVERRNVTVAELMSASGFDMRDTRYPMNAIGPAELAAEQGLNLDVLLLNYAPRGLRLVEDTLGRTLRMTARDGIQRRDCFPEIYLDGRLLSMGGYTGSPTIAMTQVSALNFLSDMGANQLYGVEVYRFDEIPPGGLAGEFGVNTDSLARCGVVAVWTKIQRERSMVAERARIEGSVQVIRGKIVDFSTGKGVPSISVALMTEFGAPLEAAIESDSTGAFVFRTRQYSRLSLAAGGGAYVALTTPAINVDPEELVTVEVILSKQMQPRAPIAVMGRELARNYPRTSFAGFSFRKRRGLGGTFIDSAEITRSGARSLTQLVSGIPDVVASADSGPAASAGPIMFRKVSPPPAAGKPQPVVPQENCTPMYFLNGDLDRNVAQVLALPPSQLRAVEVYPLATDVPFTFRIGSTGCGAMVVWTR